MKVFPEDIETSRFVIQKHPFDGEWQLTEIYDQIYRRTIYPLSNVIKLIKEKNKSSGKIAVESFVTLFFKKLRSKITATDQFETNMYLVTVGSGIYHGRTYFPPDSNKLFCRVYHI